MAPILEKVLHHIQAPLHCALHVNLTFARDVENIVKVTLMDWLVGRQCNDVLESLHSLEIRFGHAGFGSGPLYFTLSGSARIHGSFDSGGWKSFSQVLERISRVIKCSTARRFVTSLKLGGYATSPYFLGTADFAAQLGQIGPITHLEMEQYAKATDSDIIWEALRGTNPHLSSAFSTVRNLVFRDMRPEDIDGLVNTALNPSKARQSLTSGDQVKTLDNVEIHVEGRAFEVAEILAKELRKDSRIGKVLLAKEGCTEPAESDSSPRRLVDAAPIHQLPFELLIHIIHQVSQDYEGIKSYYRSLYSLSAVCRHWKLAIRSAPQLWTKLSADSSDTALAKILEQGSNRALDVECMYGRHSRSYERALHFSNTVGPTADRWRSLVMVFTPHSFESSARRILQRRFLSLEKLSFECNDLDGDLLVPDMNLFGGMSPNLKEVRINAVQCRWSQPTFKGLELIQLVRPEFVSMNALLDMLRDSPQLQSLGLWGCKFRTRSSADVPRVFLPKLRVLSIHFFSRIMAPTIQSFLNSIQTPLRCAFHVDLALARDKETIVKLILQDQLLATISQATLESLNNLELRFGSFESETTPFHCILPGSTTIHRSFDYGGWKTYCQVLECAGPTIQRLRASGFSTRLTLGSAATGSSFLGNADFASQLGQLGPIAHVKLDQYAESTESESDIIYEALRGTHPHLSSSFSAIQNLVFRYTRSEDIKRLIGAALRDKNIYHSLVSSTQTKTLDSIETQVEQQYFEEADILTKELRENSRIGKIRLYITL
ncbi:hypothetical protein FRB90_007489 [Tulasnella sp. 427]|nr:hypothetical protein FRB90_007489 [Tulasnella sp. 427]